MILSTKDKDAIRLHFNEFEGEVHVDICILCGNIEWLSTVRNKAPDVVVEPYNESNCHVCNKVRQYHPTISEWVARVIKHQWTLIEQRQIAMQEKL